MKLILKILFLAGFALLALASCDENKDEAQADLRMEITDAPVDDTEVQGVFVTVTEIQLDGEAYAPAGGPQTFDLLALQNGNTKVLLDEQLEVDTYEEIILVLDYNRDANGNNPGCYVLTQEGKDAIFAASNRLMIEFEGQITSGSTNTFVLDFDLRKAIESESDDDFNFAPLAELENSLRLVNKVEAGTIRGNCNHDIEEDQILVAYAYVEGTFNSTTEIQPDGKSFQKAVTSTRIENDGSYRLDFLPPGDYEIHFAVWEDDGDNSSPQLELMLLFNLENNLEVSVPEGGEVQLIANSTGILSL